ncbi:hypothetical protein BGW80DRAFT_1483991 [Lactifluus volemus]|nr:hypothetical protein BGW80DRAFT_1483991 [Lactifluus volemus]
MVHGRGVMVTGYGGGGVRLLYVQVVLMNARVGDLEIGDMCGQWVPSGEIRGVNGSIELKYPGPVYSRSEQILQIARRKSNWFITDMFGPTLARWGLGGVKRAIVDYGPNTNKVVDEVFGLDSWHIVKFAGKAESLSMAQLLFRVFLCLPEHRKMESKMSMNPYATNSKGLAGTIDGGIIRTASYSAKARELLRHDGPVPVCAIPQSSIQSGGPLRSCTNDGGRSCPTSLD